MKSPIEQARHYYTLMQGRDPSEVAKYAEVIRRIADEHGWENFSFTSLDLQRQANAAKITIAERYYRVALTCDPGQVPGLIALIHSIAAEVGWERLSFTPQLLDTMGKGAQLNVDRRRRA